jgi:thioredoxin 1
VVIAAAYERRQSRLRNTTRGDRRATDVDGNISCMKTQSLTDAQFKAEVLDSKEPVLVDFWATWCAPCIAMEPTLDELATSHVGKLKVVKINIEDNQVSAQAYGVRSLPNFLLFKQGKVVGQIAGAVSKQKLGDAVAKVL